MDIGSGLASFGNNFAEGMMQYHKEEEVKRRDLELVDALSRLQLPDPTNPEKQIPVFSKEATAAWNMKSTAEKAKQAGAQAAIGRMLATSHIAILKSAQEARIKAQLGETGLAGESKRARIKANESRGKLTDVQIAQQLGILPKVEQPPTGGQIMAEQRAQRKERFAQRKSILDELHVGQGDKTTFLDPELLLDKSAAKYGTLSKPKTLGIEHGKPSVFNPVDDPKKATHVQIEDGPLLKKKEHERLVEKAKKWQELGKPQAPAPTVHPKDAQTLLKNPTPEMKAMFDKTYGVPGLADTILNATQPAKESNPEPPADEPEPADNEEEETTETE